ncbi:MAG TPA: PPE domain-containing protein [Mycobacterium sp.]|nr:PPE domain-containing protein [Mycobacterium sp.]
MIISIWMASPPEVHSALLSSGPGPGPLLGAAGQWMSLSAEYASVADELAAMLGGIQAGAWRGPTTERYVAAHLPYLDWLTRASADSAAAAARCETVAGAYASALAAMPTLAELAANHAAHAVLLATNFFGINTIPIALNEADYARMWLQAATTMGAYQAVSDTTLAATAPASVAPPILAAHAVAPTDDGDDGDAGDNPLNLPQWLVNGLEKLGIGNSQLAHDPTISNSLTQFVANLLQQFGQNWNPAAGTLNGFSYDHYTDALQPIWYLARSLELFEDFLQFGTDLMQNPVLAFQWLISWQLFDFPTHILQFVTAFGPGATALGASAAASAGGLGGLAGLAGLAGIPAPASTPAGVAVPGPALPLLAAMSPAPAVAAGAVAPAPPPPPPAPAAASAAVQPPSPPPSPGVPPAGFFPPYIMGPGVGSGAGLAAAAGARAGAGRKAPEPDSAAAPAAAATERRRAQRRSRARRRGYGDAYMDMDARVDPDRGEPLGEQPDELPGTAVASGAGAGRLGFTGAVPAGAAAEAGGLAALAGDEFGGGPRVPLMPVSWGGGPD